MSKTVVSRRTKFADEKYLGSEPTITENATQSELARAYSWFNYFYTSDDAKSFTISYLKSIKYDKNIINSLVQIKAIDIHNIGWNCRLLAAGSTLPDGIWKTIETRLRILAATVVENPISTEDQPIQKVVSIQDRINNKASDLIGEIEEHIDLFFNNGVIQFDVKKWSLEKGIKPQIAKRIADKYRPQYEEIIQALEGKDKELVEAYRGWRKPVLKLLSLFIKKIIDHMVELDSASQSIRKPRKKKVKPAGVLVSKINYCVSSDTLSSVDPKGIIGASQLWTYNIKTRNLSVYHAVGHSGLSVRGTTLTGFDETTSITKKLRKPDEQVQQVLKAGKVDLRNFMKCLTTKDAKANGRINADTILLRVVR